VGKSIRQFGHIRKQGEITAILVPGKKNIVMMAIVFIARLSSLVCLRAAATPRLTIAIFWLALAFSLFAAAIAIWCRSRSILTEFNTCPSQNELGRCREVG